MRISVHSIALLTTRVGQILITLSSTACVCKNTQNHLPSFKISTFLPSKFPHVTKTARLPLQATKPRVRRKYHWHSLLYHIGCTVSHAGIVAFFFPAELALLYELGVHIVRIMQAWPTETSTASNTFAVRRFVSIKGFLCLRPAHFFCQATTAKYMVFRKLPIVIQPLQQIPFYFTGPVSNPALTCD